MSRRKRAGDDVIQLDLTLFPKQSMAVYTPGKLEILYGGKYCASIGTPL